MLFLLTQGLTPKFHYPWMSLACKTYLWCLSIDDFLFPSFLIRLLVGILCIEDLSMLFIYLIMYLYQYRLTNTYFILWGKIQYCHYSFYYLNYPCFGHWKFFQNGLWFLLTCWLLSMSLRSSTMKCPRLVFYFPSSVRAPFIGEWYLETNIWALGVLLAAEKSRKYM